MTRAEALEYWNGLTPMQRLAIMETVGPFKSITEKHRACLAAVQAGARA